jgi:small basic protein (TIGR04137 family)
MDRSLKSKNVLARHRNVLTRAERLEVLEEDDRWSDSDSVFGLPKVAHRRTTAGHKEKKAETPEETPGAEEQAAETPEDENK